MASDFCRKCDVFICLRYICKKHRYYVSCFYCAVRVFASFYWRGRGEFQLTCLLIQLFERTRNCCFFFNRVCNWAMMIARFHHFWCNLFVLYDVCFLLWDTLGICCFDIAMYILQFWILNVEFWWSILA